MEVGSELLHLLPANFNELNKTTLTHLGTRISEMYVVNLLIGYNLDCIGET
jgi:hypothetical protein